MLQSKDLPLGSERVGRRQLSLGVEAWEVVRGCGRRWAVRAWGKPKVGQLPLKVCMEGGDAGEMRAGVCEGRWSLPSSSSRAKRRAQGLESNRPGCAP